MTLPVRLAVLGCGRVFQRFHLPAIDRVPTIELIAACDTDRSRFGWTEGRSPRPAVFGICLTPSTGIGARLALPEGRASCSSAAAAEGLMTSIILFDFGGTLDSDGERWCVRFHQAYLSAGGSQPLQEFEYQFRRSDRLLEQLAGIRGMGFGDMINAQAELLRSLICDGAVLDWGVVGETFCDQARATITRNRPLLQRLAARRPLGIVSNFTGNLGHCLAELDLLALFEVVIDSGLIGTSKPDPAIFLHALKSSGQRPETAWMVGDNFEADIRPAAALGMATAWLAPPGQTCPAPEVVTARIGRLLELEPLVA